MIVPLVLCGRSERHCEGRGRERCNGIYLGVLFEEEALVADFEHENNAWVLLLYA